MLLSLSVDEMRFALLMLLKLEYNSHFVAKKKKSKENQYLGVEDLRFKYSLSAVTRIRTLTKIHRSILKIERSALYRILLK